MGRSEFRQWPGIEEGLAHAAVLKGGMGNMQWHK